jgi:hypothetical protein
MLLHSFSKQLLLVAYLVEFSLQTGSVRQYPIEILERLSHTLTQVPCILINPGKPGTLKESMPISFQIIIYEPFMIIFSCITSVAEAALLSNLSKPSEKLHVV